MDDLHGLGDPDDLEGTAQVRERKRSMRASARERRAASDPADRAADAAAWTAHLLRLPQVESARVVAAYESYGAEPPTDDLIAALRAAGVRVLLPVLEGDRDLDWTEGGVRLGRAAIASADVVVVPALLVGEDGARLGQGGGSYDRALARVPAGTPLVALLHDDEVVAAGEVPSEPHDHAVDHVVTPSRMLTVGPHAHGALRHGFDNPVPIDPDVTEPPAGARARQWDVALVVAAGGAIGSIARWGLNEAVPHGAAGFPWSTFVENALGCLLLGALMVFLLDVWPSHPYARPFLGIGVLGGFTTFSTYTVDTRLLLDEGRGLVALTYLFGTLLVGLLATWVGLAAGRALAGVPQRSLAGPSGGSAR